MTGGDAGKLRVWNLGSGKEIQKYEGHKSGIHCITVSNDGKLVVTGSKKGEMISWA